MDLHIHLNNKQYILVEMQVYRFSDWPERTLVYACRKIDEQAVRPEPGKPFEYSDLQPVIQVSIMDYTLFPEHKEFFSSYKLLNDKTLHPYTDKLQFKVLDLTAMDLATPEDQENGLVMWAEAFQATTWEELSALAEKSPILKEAEDTMKQIMSTRENRELLTMREFAIMDAANQVTAAKRETAEKIQGQNSQLAFKLKELNREDDFFLVLTDNDYRQKLLQEFHIR